MNVGEEVQRAQARIQNHVRRTPIEESLLLDPSGHAHLKLENTQRTGSFKLRGATNKLLALKEGGQTGGVVAASTGNHGMAVASAAKKLGLSATVFAPENAAAGKLEGMQRLGAEVRLHGPDCLVAELAAREFARAQGAEYVSPYNDPDVVAGQGTLAMELLEDLPDLEAVVVSVGGGGLISGIGGYLRAVRPEVRVIAVSPKHSAAMAASIEVGRVIDVEHLPTLSDGTAGGMEDDTITFDLCRDSIDEFVLVDEEEIAAGMRVAIQGHHTLVEGAAGAAIAGYERMKDQLAGKCTAIVLCGANVDGAVLAEVLA